MFSNVVYQNEKIYIEIAVTHFLSVDKLNSGFRIIELALSSEDDILNILNSKLLKADNKVHFHNFKIQHKIGCFCSPGNCCNKFIFFTISLNGKCNMKILKEWDLESYQNKYNSQSLWSILTPLDNQYDEDDDHDHWKKDVFKQNVAKAFREKVNVRNCYICRYHAENFSMDFTNNDPIFCKFQKFSCKSNYATNCNFFKSDPIYYNE